MIAMILNDHLNLCANLAKRLKWITVYRQMITGAYPMATFKLRKATGNTVPPIDDAKEIIPNAVDRLCLNQWATILITGPNMTPHEIYNRPQLDYSSSQRRES